MPTLSPSQSTFIDRRSYDPGVGRPGPGAPSVHQQPRRAFTEARELAVAIDEYKLVHRRRFITYEEMLSVVKSLGYQK